MDQPSRKRPRTGGEEEHTLKQIRARPVSGFYGVRAKRKRWQAKITYDGKKHTIGSFDTKEEAALAYDMGMCANKPSQWYGLIGNSISIQ